MQPAAAKVQVALSGQRANRRIRLPRSGCLNDDDLEHIRTLGFRGEALPSIGSVARMTITSRARDASDAWAIHLEGGAKDGPGPAAHPVGTTVEVRDLFFATPARLKFLKSARSESLAVIDTIKRLAMTAQHKTARRVFIETMREHRRLRQAKHQMRKKLLHMVAAMFCIRMRFMHGNACGLIDHQHHRVTIKNSALDLFRTHKSAL